jgi:hypothetical protein
MKAEPGAELACRARNYRFEHHGSHQEHGVISYYATQTLAQATTLASWIQRAEALSRADLQHGSLPSFYQPLLQILGNAATKLPGNPVHTDAEQHK